MSSKHFWPAILVLRCLGNGPAPTKDICACLNAGKRRNFIPEQVTRLLLLMESVGLLERDDVGYKLACEWSEYTIADILLLGDWDSKLVASGFIGQLSKAADFPISKLGDPDA